MEQPKIKWRESGHGAQVDQLLARQYNRLSEWAAVLSRGDRGKAEEIVQDLCLYFTLTRPDLSGIANLDGYLYTCLRNIYVSSLARSSREALHVVSIAEFECFESALSANRSGDPLQRQNDLRRICGFAVWRKESSKSASYFILRFFHGYGHREIAELACLPIAAIYNKLKIARAEVKSYLEDAGNLRIVDRGLPPEPTLSWSLLSSGEIFNELREVILRARTSGCLSEEELLGHYRSSMPRPISCSLLAHIVSCERCLAIVDRHFRRPTLMDREPLDGFGSVSDKSTGIGSAGPSGVAYKAMSQAVRKRWGKVHEHCPRTLSIAVNGRIIAFYDVQAERNKLSARIDHPEKAQFVEVFSEQDVRLALLSIGELPPDGPQVQTQRVLLSDARWLELNLTFDGLGLHSEVTYFDPALAVGAIEEDTDESAIGLESMPNTSSPMSSALLRAGTAYAALMRTFRALAPSSAIAWALTLAILFTTAGYFASRHSSVSMDGKDILNKSVKIEAADLQGQTEHQVVRIEEVSADGQVLQQDVIDLWKDGDGNRYIRRLYDSRHRMIAAEWRNKNGEHSLQRNSEGNGASGSGRSMLVSELWNQDLSARAFSKLGDEPPQVHAVDGGYELTSVGPTADRPQLVSATLVLNRHLVPDREIMRVRADGEIYELHFVQEDYERRPSASVPDAAFGLDGGQRRPSAIRRHHLPNAMGSDVQLAELQIDVLYRLNHLGADTGEPIEVLRTPDGRIRVSGTIADDALRQKIVSQLQTLAGHQFLDLRLVSPRDLPVRHPGVEQTFTQDATVYDISQTKSSADATLRRYFQTKGLSGKRLDYAVEQFSHDALQQAQLALENAYALDRLARAFSATELESVSPSSQRHWTEMVHKHASELESQLRATRAQLAELLPSNEDLPIGGGAPVRIEGPAQFEQAANQLLRETQDLNRDVGGAFASNATAGASFSASEEKQSGQGALLKATLKAIPLRQAAEIADFAVQLDASGSSADVDRQSSGDGTKTSGQPR